MDFKDCLQNKQLSIALPDLAKELREMPEKTLDCLGLAIHQVSVPEYQSYIIILHRGRQRRACIMNTLLHFLSIDMS